MTATATRVSFYDFPARSRADREAILRSVAETAQADEFILKGRVAALEARLAALTGAGHVVAVASGTSALTVGLSALGVGPGTAVLVPAFGFHAPASCVANLGGHPVLVDVSPDTGTLDPERLAERTTTRTRGVVPAHLFSLMADMPALREAADREGLWTFEDAAIALGMRWGGHAAGRFGRLGLYSFHPAKPLAGVSDGGALVTDDPALAEQLRMLRNHGQDGVRRLVHHVVGFNARMDELNARVLLHRLAGYERALAAREEVARRYDAAFADLEPRLRRPPPTPCERLYYTYVVRSERRDALARFLEERGIETRVYYPWPLHLQPAFAFLGHSRGDFPRAEAWSASALALPLHPALAASTVDRVIDAVRSFHA